MTGTSSRLILEVRPTRRLYLFRMSSGSKPGRSVGTRKPRIAFELSGSTSSPSVFAQMIATSAMSALPIHILPPPSRHPVPSRRATVVMPPGFEPWAGSVNPKHPSFSPVRMVGSQ